MFPCITFYTEHTTEFTYLILHSLHTGGCNHCPTVRGMHLNLVIYNHFSVIILSNTAPYLKPKEIYKV